MGLIGLVLAPGLAAERCWPAGIAQLRRLYDALNVQGNWAFVFVYAARAWRDCCWWPVAIGLVDASCFRPSRITVIPDAVVDGLLMCFLCIWSSRWVVSLGAGLH